MEDLKSIFELIPGKCYTLASSSTGFQYKKKYIFLVLSIKSTNPAWSWASTLRNEREITYISNVEGLKKEKCTNNIFYNEKCYLELK